jgi:type IV secretion system protein TrbG
MTRSLTLLVCLIAGCTLGGPPAEPPVPPAPEDLSTWTVPELVPEAPLPPPQRSLPPATPPTAAEKVYAYVPGNIYTVPVSIGFPLDIQFGRGEQVHNVTDGDRAPCPTQEGASGTTAQAGAQNCRWDIQQGREGVGDAQRHHLFVAVKEPGLKNGLVITTTKQAYQITLESVKHSPIRILRWTYEQEPVEVTEMTPLPAGPLPPLDGPARYYVGFQLASRSGTAPTWMPRQIVDDGKKTYIIYPESVLFESVPLLRLMGPNGPQVVNARQYLNVLIVDQRIASAELRVGTGAHAEVVTIRRGALQMIHCPDSPECPRWPAAARALRRRVS